MIVLFKTIKIADNSYYSTIYNYYFDLRCRSDILYLSKANAKELKCKFDETFGKITRFQCHPADQSSPVLRYAM